MQKNYYSEHERHETLKAFIREKIQQAGGDIPFVDYMQYALYTPELGYYMAHPHIFGGNEQKDFITAPEISPLFGQTLAQVCSAILEKISEGVILEFGAGTGKLAEDVLNVLDKQGKLPRAYWIVDPSPHLREIQRQRLDNHPAREKIELKWFDKLPDGPFAGIVIANEVLDALPAQRFQITDTHCFEAFVTYHEGGFQEEYQMSHDPAIEQLAQHIRAENSLEVLKVRPYQSERLPGLKTFFKTLSAALKQGVVLLMDYGFPRHEFYHPDRYMGTLMCHQQQRAHIDPYREVGLQDITTHVDFTDVAEQASDTGFDIAGYTQQAAFLMNAGLLSLCTHENIAVGANNIRPFEAKTALHLLTSPSEMGELFKVMALTKAIDLFPFPGFEHFDKRHTL